MPNRIQERLTVKRLYHIAFLVLISSSLAQATSFHAVTQNPDPQNYISEFGITQYPLAVPMPEATKRLNQIKAGSWLLSKVFQTESHIEDVTNYFKKQAVIGNKTAANKSVEWLMWNNWNIRTYKFSELPAVFGLGAQLTVASSAEQVKATFGVIVLSDSLVRINLLSPYPTEDNKKFASGTMISIIREPLPERSPGDEDHKPDKERVYSAKEVDQKISILSKPQAEMPEPWGESIVTLRVVFSSTGKVKNVEVIGGPKDRFARAAMAAARKIKFTPAIKDGRSVSQVGRLEYRFSKFEESQVEFPVPQVQLPTRRKPE